MPYVLGVLRTVHTVATVCGDSAHVNGHLPTAPEWSCAYGQYRTSTWDKGSEGYSLIQGDLQHHGLLVPQDINALSHELCDRISSGTNQSNARLRWTRDVTLAKPRTKPMAH